MFIFLTLCVCHKAWISNFLFGGLNVHSVFYTIWTFICHHCGVGGHTRPKCYKWLATQQSNGMIASGSQNQLQSSLAPLEDLFKAFMFLSNLNGFNSSPTPPIQGFNQRKGSSMVWKEKGSKWFYHFSLSLFLFLCVHYLCALLSSFELV